MSSFQKCVNLTVSTVTAKRYSKRKEAVKLESSIEFGSKFDVGVCRELLANIMGGEESCSPGNTWGSETLKLNQKEHFPCMTRCWCPSQTLVTR